MTGKYMLVGREVIPTDDLMEWAEWFENSENRRVAFDELEGGEQVSTIFLGLDHSFGDGPPLLFETMVFGDGETEDLTRRYATYEEARAGHTETMELLERRR